MVTLASIHATAHTGAAGVGVFAENSVEPRSSWCLSRERVSQVQVRKHKTTETGIRKSESAIVVMKRVMIVDRRADGQIERERETMTVHSNDGLSWLTKLERIGEKSAANKHKMFSNLGHLVNVDMLKGQFLLLDGNKATGIDGMD
jgi:hypothetical protein